MTFFFHFSTLHILDRHHAWRSLDPTLDIWSNFVKKEALTFCMYIRQTKVPTQFFSTRPNFLYVFTHITRVIMGQKNC